MQRALELRLRVVSVVTFVLMFSFALGAAATSQREAGLSQIYNGMVLAYVVSSVVANVGSGIMIARFAGDLRNTIANVSLRMSMALVPLQREAGTGSSGTLPKTTSTQSMRSEAATAQLDLARKRMDVLQSVAKAHAWRWGLEGVFVALYLGLGSFPFMFVYVVAQKAVGVWVMRKLYYAPPSQQATTEDGNKQRTSLWMGTARKSLA